MFSLCQGKGIIFHSESSKNKGDIENYREMDLAEEILCIKNISIIPMNKDIYEKYKSNKLKLLVLVAAISFKKEGILDFDLQNILSRINILLKYYDVEHPEFINNKVYLKPNVSKITSMIKIKELGNVCF